ncbi:hypothetical protein V1527DRAFT_478913, partial [Lipomyces starkeyi]
MWWPKRGKGPVEDSQIQCNRCNWKTTDSSGATSTSNMIAHLAKHGIFPSDHQGDREDAQTSAKQRSIASFFQKKADNNRARLSEQNLTRWIVTANMAFDAIESPDFQRIFQDLTISLPFTSLGRRYHVGLRRNSSPRRAQLIDGLDRTCQTISISLDVWTSRNSKSIWGLLVTSL